MNRIENLLISPEAEIKSALEVIDKGSAQIAFVVDERRKLLGSVTDGDIRRAILQSVSLSAPVSQIMATRPFFASQGDSPAQMLKEMTQNFIHQLPILDDQGTVVDVVLLEELVGAGSQQPQKNWVVLMAGGLGTRLRPLTENVPKPMLSVGDRPILETIIQSFCAQNFRNFYVSVNYKADMVKNYFGDGAKWGAEIRYLEEDKSLGTAGALSLIKDKIDTPLIVMNGDILSTVNYMNILKFHRDNGANATMCVREYDFQVPYGVVKANGHNFVSVDEKPVHTFFVNAGIYTVAPEALDRLQENEFMDMPELFTRLAQDGESVSIYPIREYWVDIGRIDDFHRANADFDKHFKGGDRDA